MDIEALSMAATNRKRKERSQSNCRQNDKYRSASPLCFVRLDPSKMIYSKAFRFGEIDLCTGFRAQCQLVTPIPVRRTILSSCILSSFNDEKKVHSRKKR